jgi:hypothetical protein
MEDLPKDPKIAGLPMFVLGSCNQYRETTSMSSIRINLALVTVFLSTSAFAAEPPVITSVSDIGGQLSIVGNGFDRGVTPVVELGSNVLVVTAFSDTQITATLPGSITAGDFLLFVDNSKKEVTYDLTLGAVGPTGPAGPPGGVDGYEIAIDETVVDDFPIKQLQVNCPAGKNALGAGWAVLDSTSAILDGRATTFQPAFDGSSWLVNAVNDSTFEANWKLKVWVICAIVGS